MAAPVLEAACRDGEAHGERLAALRRLLDGGVDLVKAVVKVSDVVGRHLDPGRKRRLLCLNRQCDRRPLVTEWQEVVCAEDPHEYYAGKDTEVPRTDNPDF